MTLILEQMFDRVAKVIQSERAEELNERLGILIAQHHAIGAEIVGCLTELDEIEGWQGEGYRSQAHWLSIRGGFTMAEASRFATVAARAANVSTILAHAREGRFSVGVVAMAARVANAQERASDRASPARRHAEPGRSHLPEVPRLPE